MTRPFNAATDRQFRISYVEIASRLHVAEFDLSRLMSDVLALFERANPNKARAQFTDYVGASFPRLDQPKLALTGAQRKRFYLMALEHRKFVARFKKNAAQVWNDMGGWLSVTILNGLRAPERSKAELVILSEVRDRGVGVTVSTVRSLLSVHHIRPGKPGRPRHADRDAGEALVRAQFINLIRSLQLAALKVAAKRSDADKALLNAVPANLVAGALRKAGRHGNRDAA